MGRKSYLDKYQPYIDIVMSDLGLTNKVNIQCEFGNWKSMGGDCILWKLTDTDGKRMGRVRVSKQSTHSYILETILHELKHIQQMYTERLSNTRQQMYKTKRGTIACKWVCDWEGKTIDFYTNSKNLRLDNLYKNQPFEAEAYEYQKKWNTLFPNGKLATIRQRIGKVGKTTFYKVKEL